jgi:hypothetical protein
MGKDEVRKAVIESFDGDLVTAEQGIENFEASPPS